MGVIVKYQLEFPEAFKVSNDLFKGDFIIDADIVAAMMRGVNGGIFEITLYDLPEKKVKELNNKLKELNNKLKDKNPSKELNNNLKNEKLPRVIIRLGYFDGPFELVMEGIYTSIISVSKGDQLVTTLKGLESATYALLNTDAQGECDGEVGIAEVVKCLFQISKPPKEQIDQEPLVEKNLSAKVRDVAFRSQKLMGVLGELADRTGAELLVLDKKVRLGKPIKDDTYGPVKLDRDVNLAVFQPFAKGIPAETDQAVLNPLPATEVQGFKFTITGDPQLRPARKVVPKIDGFDQASGPEFRVYCVTHSLSVTSGYVCQGIATRLSADSNLTRQADAACERSAAAIVQSLTQRMQAEQRLRPSIEIGAVKAYAPEEHRSTLYFGQPSERTETQPSVRAAVEANEQQLFRNKPIVSPFAWHKCGLMVPVYPGMKALLTHNMASLNDALIGGFIWSENPTIEPPKNKEGDWWLCLPIDFDTSKAPSDSTKAANDLIANNGKRVIEVKGLKITVGKGSLLSVGERPAEGEDDEFLIEHKSGTTFKIAADGSLSIEASKVSIKGDVTIEGNVEII